MFYKNIDVIMKNATLEIDRVPVHKCFTDPVGGTDSPISSFTDEF
jgi:hypothetical protein